MKGIKTILTFIAAYAGLGGALIAFYNQFIGPGYGLSGLKGFLINIPGTIKQSWQNYVYGAVVLVVGFWLIGMWKSKGSVAVGIKAVLMFVLAMYGSAYIFGGIKGVAWGGYNGIGTTSTAGNQTTQAAKSQAATLKGMN